MRPPFFTWDGFGVAHCAGRWKIDCKVIVDAGGKQRVCFWIDDMPDWARRIQLTFKGRKADPVRWGQRGSLEIGNLAEHICDLALERGILTLIDDEWALTSLPAIDLAVG